MIKKDKSLNIWGQKFTQVLLPEFGGERWKRAICLSAGRVNMLSALCTNALVKHALSSCSLGLPRPNTAQDRLAVVLSPDP